MIAIYLSLPPSFSSKNAEISRYFGNFTEISDHVAFLYLSAQQMRTSFTWLCLYRSEILLNLCRSPCRSCLFSLDAPIVSLSLTLCPPQPHLACICKVPKVTNVGWLNLDGNDKSCSLRVSNLDDENTRLSTLANSTTHSSLTIFTSLLYIFFLLPQLICNHLSKIFPI